jgi:hypothetical protein
MPVVASHRLPLFIKEIVRTSLAQAALQHPTTENTGKIMWEDDLELSVIAVDTRRLVANTHRATTLWAPRRLQAEREPLQLEYHLCPRKSPR